MKVIFAIVLLLSSTSVFAGDFVTTWKTDNPGPSNDTSIQVPMIGGPYDVDWDNDGIFDELGINGTVTHDYMVAGTYTIRVRGLYDSIRFIDDKFIHFGLIIWLGDGEKIVSLDQWGTNPWASMQMAFAGASNLQIPATDIPDFSTVTDMSGMFSRATLANPDVSGWDTSKVTDMSQMFDQATSANPDTGNWDTSAVTDMSRMFDRAVSANPDTSGWDTSAVTSMQWIFYGAISANPDTSSWDTSSVVTMVGMFSRAISANPDTSGWDTSGVLSMGSMFSGATSADPDTSDWDTSAVEDMNSVFFGATLANPDTSGWDTSAVTDMSQMFERAISATPDTSDWDTSAVKYMDSMFFDAISANPDTSGWDTSLVTRMQWMFANAMSANPDTSNWDTSSVVTLEGIFSGATSFGQNLGAWDVTALQWADHMFAGLTLSRANYEGLLIGWSAQNVYSGVYFDGGNSTFCSAEAASARERLITDYSWEITDGGQSCHPTGIRATDGDYPNFVRITFNPVPDATVYRVYRCSDKGYTCGSPIGYTKTTTFNDGKGISEKVYYYRVRACVSNQCSKFSVADTGFTTPAPDRPTGVRATDGAYEDRVRVTFDSVERATVYRVFRCPDRGYTCGLPIGYPKTGTFDDKKVEPGIVFYYRVRACTATTCGKFSVADVGHRAAITSTESDENVPGMNLVPNGSLKHVPIPSLNNRGRWLLIIMILGFGWLMFYRRYVPPRRKF